jgi:hypothetical protein
LPAPLFVVSLAARDPGLAQSNINKNIKEEIVSFVGYFTLYFRMDLRVFWPGNCTANRPNCHYNQ